MKSKRSSRRKPVPAILRAPIKESDFPQNQTVAEQIESRLQAVFDYYDIKRSDPSSAFQWCISWLGIFYRRGLGACAMEPPGQTSASGPAIAKLIWLSS